MRAAVPSQAMLYSLLHLNGFEGDLAFYSKRTSGAGRILELGAGDGRMGAALDAAVEYTGVESCSEFVELARERLPSGTVLEADMLAPLPAGTPPFDTVVLTANTLFCTPHHAELLSRCHEALAPGGALLFDVYNAVPWHEDALEDEAAEEAGDDEASAGGEGEGEGEGEEESDLLVRAVDASGREWDVYERDPEIDTSQQRITCRYDFEAATGEQATQVNVHHYALPDELRTLLDGAGFDVEAAYGGFGEEPFDVDESEHLVFAARRRD